MTNQNIVSKDFTFDLCKDTECKELINNYSANVENGTALIPVQYGIWYIKEKSAPQGYAISSEVVKVELNENGLFVNDNLVETDEELTYSIIYQNSLLPVIQTGYNDNPTIYIAIGCLSLAGLSSMIIYTVKKRRRK